MSDLMREDFVQWLRTRPEVLNVGFDPVSGRFVLREDQERWEAWQASRECLVIDLPKPAGLDRMSSEMSIQEIREDNRFNRALELAKKALTAAGVKTK